MTLPALGVIGLTFLCLLLIGGVTVLVVMTNDNLRFRLCELIASYRDPRGEKEAKRSRKKHSKSKRRDNAYTSRIPPPPLELQAYRDENQYEPFRDQHSPHYVSTAANPPHIPQTGHQHHHHYRGIPDSNSLHHPHQLRSMEHHTSGNSQYHPSSHHTQAQLYSSSGGHRSSGSAAERASQVHIGHYSHSRKPQHHRSHSQSGLGSTGTNSPHDSAIGSTSGGYVEKKGILKNKQLTKDITDGNMKRDSGSRTSDRHKHVHMQGYPDPSGIEEIA